MKVLWMGLFTVFMVSGCHKQAGLVGPITKASKECRTCVMDLCFEDATKCAKDTACGKARECAAKCSDEACVKGCIKISPVFGNLVDCQDSAVEGMCSDTCRAYAKRLEKPKPVKAAAEEPDVSRKETEAYTGSMSCLICAMKHCGIAVPSKEVRRYLTCKSGCGVNPKCYEYCGKRLPEGKKQFDEHLTCIVKEKGSHCKAVCTRPEAKPTPIPMIGTRTGGPQRRQGSWNVSVKVNTRCKACIARYCDVRKLNALQRYMVCGLTCIGDAACARKCESIFPGGEAEARKVMQCADNAKRQSCSAVCGK